MGHLSPGLVLEANSRDRAKEEIVIEFSQLDSLVCLQPVLRGDTCVLHVINITGGSALVDLMSATTVGRQDISGESVLS